MFAGYHCEGPTKHDPDCDVNLDEMSPVKEEQTLARVTGDKQDALLSTIPALSSQVEALQLEQQSQRDTVTLLRTTRAKIGGGAPKHEASACTDNKSLFSTVFED